MLSTLLAFCVAAATGLPEQSPNVVVIHIDDLNAAWELPAVIAPNMRALAERGVNFSRAYAAHPLCAPSRAALLAGQRVHRTQYVSNEDPLPASPVNGVPYLPCRLREAGYYTAGVGKIFHDAQPQYWDEYHDYTDDPWIVQPVVPHDPSNAGLVTGGPFQNGPACDLGKMADTKRVDKGRALLLEGKQRLDETGQPFLVWLGLEATHDPFVYPEMYGSFYAECDVPALPDGESGDWKGDVNAASYKTGWYYDPAWAPDEAGQRVQAMLAYFRCLSYIDEQVGRVLEALDTLCLAEDTIVVLVSDHGWSFSEHDHVGKTTGFEEDIVAPLLIAVPDLPATHGRTVTTPVSQVDLYPTLMDLLGLSAPNPLEGASLVPLLRDIETPHPPVFYTTDEEWGFNLTRYVVKRDEGTGEIWKLGAWEKDDTIPQLNQLYNLTTDPGEYENLYRDLELTAKVQELRAELEAVGLLGPASRSFGAGTAGQSGVPELTWSGVPALGAPGTLVIGNSSGVDTLGLIGVGFSGSPSAGPKSLAIKASMLNVIGLPAAGLSVPVALPAAALYDELPIGVQVVQLDPAASCGISRSRGLSIFLSN